MRRGLVVLPLMALVACGAQTAGADPAPGDGSGQRVERPTAVPAAAGEVTTGGPVTVLDDGDGAELCLGGVMTSLPPQCGGPRLVGWDWSEHVGDFESVSGTRWGEFVVAGTFDGTDLTPSRVLPAAEYDAPDLPDEPRHETPCPEPADGWIVDASSASERDSDAAFRVASGLADYAGAFVDTSLDPRTPEEVDHDAADGAGPDVTPWIVNVSVTEDPAAAEDAIREVWGGGLCVTRARFTEAELLRFQDATFDWPGVTSSGSGGDRVDVGVVYDDGSIQAWADQEHGVGVVIVTSSLRPGES